MLFSILSIGLYQWSDQENAILSQLTSWWLERRSICRAVTSEGSNTEPAVPKSVQHFRDQEKVRLLEHPTKPFMYDLGMISHKKSLITIFGLKHKIKNFIKKFYIFHKKFQQLSILVYIWNKIANFESKLH